LKIFKALVYAKKKSKSTIALKSKHKGIVQREITAVKKGLKK
jgi:hypothetical protein